jgi:hypothetical protein
MARARQPYIYVQAYTVGAGSTDIAFRHARLDAYDDDDAYDIGPSHITDYKGDVWNDYVIPLAPGKV